MERTVHPESRTMSEVGGVGGENIFYAWEFFGDPNYPQNGIITKKGGADFSLSYNEDVVFIYRHEKWWAIDCRDAENPLTREAREDELESLNVFIKEAICIEV